MTFLYEHDNIYTYKTDNGIILSVGANSKSEALSIINNKTSVDEITRKKRELIKTIKSKTNTLLTESDYKVLRHRDQLDLGLNNTTITSQEYSDLLEERQLLRDNSNILENNINAMNTLEELNNFDISNLISLLTQSS
jgi:prophage DNA circulation protein